MLISVLAQALDLIAVLTERLAGLQALMEPPFRGRSGPKLGRGTRISNGPEWPPEAGWADIVSVLIPSVHGDRPRRSP
jgi:hypothetical protein